MGATRRTWSSLLWTRGTGSDNGHASKQKTEAIGKEYDGIGPVCLCCMFYSSIQAFCKTHWARSFSIFAKIFIAVHENYEYLNIDINEDELRYFYHN